MTSFLDFQLSQKCRFAKKPLQRSKLFALYATSVGQLELTGLS